MATHFILKNNISANNTTSDFYQYHSTTVVDNGYNIIGVAAGNAVSWAGTTTIGLPANLNLSSTLDANGSGNISPTLALLENSVAINAGNSSANGIFSVPCTDQRGLFSNSTKDIGAFEYQGLSYGPSITTSTTAITNLNYYSGLGPSTSQSFTVSGTNLTGNVVLTAPTYFEISTASSYSSSITLIPVSGTLVETTINVRLKSGYGVSTYSGTLTVVTNCDNDNVSLSGSCVVTLPASTRIWTGASSTNWSTGSNWSGSTVPTSTVGMLLIPASVTNFHCCDIILSQVLLHVII
jgi:hypothetical protein